MQFEDVATLGGEPTRNRDLRSRGRQTIARLITAGQEVVEERGHDQARVDDIVERAGVSHGTFYLYFKDRDDLLRSLIKMVARQLLPLADTLPHDPSPVDLAEWITRAIAAFDEHVEVLRAARSMGNDEAIAGLIPEVAAALRGATEDECVLASALALGHIEKAAVRDDIVDVETLAVVTLRAAGALVTMPV